MKDTTVAIVPIRSISAGKTRLASVLTESERTSLTMAMLNRAVAAITAADEVARVIVISPDQDTLDYAAGLHQRIVPLRQDHPASGLDGAIEQATRAATGAGAANLLIVFGDLPFLTPDELRNVLRRDAPVVIGADNAMTGTNVLMLRRGAGLENLQAFRYLYGPGSYLRHLQEAHDLGLDVVTVNAPGIAFDLDTPEDLEQLGATRDVLLQEANAAHVPVSR